MSSEKPIAMFQRRWVTQYGHPVLVPNNEDAVDLMNTIKRHDTVQVEIKRPRNYKRLQAYWAMLRSCVDATGCAPSTDALHDVIKLGTGHFDAVILKATGETKLVPASISFAAMTEREFIDYFQSAQLWLAENIGYEGGSYQGA